MPKQRLKSTRKAIEQRVAKIIRRAAMVQNYAQELNEEAITDNEQRHLLYVLDNANSAIDQAFEFYERHSKAVRSRVREASTVNAKESWTGED